MNKLKQQVIKAQHSPWQRWLLNIVLLRTVPFNKPHRLLVKGWQEDTLSMYAPFRRKNLNHIKGIHACLLATLCEYVSGLSLLLHLSPQEYRIILKNIHMTYHYQAKKEVHVKFRLSEEEVQKILLPLQSSEAVFHEFTVDVFDTDENHICTGLINWQIKAWKNVKLKTGAET